MLRDVKETVQLTTEGYEQNEFSILEAFAPRQTCFQCNLSYVEALTELQTVTPEITGLQLPGPCCNAERLRLGPGFLEGHQAHVGQVAAERDEFLAVGLLTPVRLFVGHARAPRGQLFDQHLAMGIQDRSANLIARGEVEHVDRQSRSAESFSFASGGADNPRALSMPTERSPTWC